MRLAWVHYHRTGDGAWLGNLISHESHHRGQILLALKQSGHKLPAKVTRDGMWGAWIRGK